MSPPVPTRLSSSWILSPGIQDSALRVVSSFAAGRLHPSRPSEPPRPFLQQEPSSPICGLGGGIRRQVRPSHLSRAIVRRPRVPRTCIHHASSFPIFSAWKSRLSGPAPLLPACISAVVRSLRCLSNGSAQRRATPTSTSHIAEAFRPTTAESTRLHCLPRYRARP